MAQFERPLISPGCNYLGASIIWEPETLDRPLPQCETSPTVSHLPGTLRVHRGGYGRERLHNKEGGRRAGLDEVGRSEVMEADPALDESEVIIPARGQGWAAGSNDRRRTIAPLLCGITPQQMSQIRGHHELSSPAARRVLTPLQTRQAGSQADRTIQGSTVFYKHGRRVHKRTGPYRVPQYFTNTAGWFTSGQDHRRFHSILQTRQAGSQADRIIGGSTVFYKHGRQVHKRTGS
ncbi:hypothetical protein J6590_051685 [Homalodisca vitripennis]|nr:hypothetical protein J6590_051685 [Homalodisca vitripennis]